jgi:hypothetical protein
MKDQLYTYGPLGLCTWRYGPGICGFQTTRPQIARKLTQRSAKHLGISPVSLRISVEELQRFLVGGQR